jgi:amino-acid N-acetyltransferase
MPRMATKPNPKPNFERIRWFRETAPYVHAHRGRTFVVLMGGEQVQDAGFTALVHDLALLAGLGVRLVLVHGARPQIDAQLKRAGRKTERAQGLRVTDSAAMESVIEAVGRVRIEIEAQFSAGLANSPMAGAHLRISSGNFITARPLGVREGVDFQHTGEVRRVDHAAIETLLNQQHIVLLSPLGFSPTGEAYNLRAEEVATASAIALGADKLVQLIDGRGLLDGRKRLIRELRPDTAEDWLNKRTVSEDIQWQVRSAIDACRAGVARAHLVDAHTDGGLLLELFTRDGTGTLITAERYETLRAATIDDIGGILELIQPLEQSGVLVSRPREQLEQDLPHFTVMERDGTIIACAARIPLGKHKAELAAFVVHPDYQNAGRGETLLQHIELAAIQAGEQELYLLTTRTSDWFREHGFLPATRDALPAPRRALYNHQRNSKVLCKALSAT